MSNGPGPMGYQASILSMSSVVAMAYYDELENRGVKKTRAALIAAYAEEAAFPELDDEIVMRPADEALRVAVKVMANAFDDAMNVHGIPAEFIDFVAVTVRTEVEQVVATHIDYRKRVSESSTDVPGEEGETESG
ncbi:hypothetical protein AGRA3207_000206 [Actinomadura graeca]|uniref:Uncharacterized protein n=1 Tax=Actinomadura graeca TaxID=2750812 RepID=A0ABX8QS59_9ACTN|nr:hypothetical protein [Actinomadura graeca]QXJ19643.1 hypothetical protein AGRA3207_000206 [Actinomadura graeca]